MCVVAAPILMAVMAATTVASTAMSVIAAGKQADAQTSAANYQAQVARNNQIIAQQQEQATNDAEAPAEQAQRMKTAQIIGQERASLAGNGVDPNSGSSLDVQSDAAKMGELDALSIRSNYARQAYGYKVQGMSAGAQAGLYTAQGGWAQQAGQLNQWTSILSGASSLASKWGMYSMAGGGGGDPAGYSPTFGTGMGR